MSALNILFLHRWILSVKSICFPCTFRQLLGWFLFTLKYITDG